MSQRQSMQSKCTMMATICGWLSWLYQPT